MINMLGFKISCILVLCVIAVCKCEGNKDAELNESYCEGTGWDEYGDEKCFKLFKKPSTREEAKLVCEQEASQLVSIKSAAEQEYLTEFVFDTSAVVVNIWIGAKRLSGNNFVWDDGSNFDFTNWAEDSPTSDPQRGCILMQSDFTREFSSLSQKVGKWKDATCEQWNYVVCEKLQKWSITKLQQLLLDTRKELGFTKNELSQTTIRLSNQIEDSKRNSVPIGFIYVQLPHEKTVTEIWPLMQWTDVSTAYAGVFFRVNGGNAAAFGQVQEEFSPWLSKFSRAPIIDSTEEIEIPRSGWSKAICAAAHGNTCLPTKFHTTGGEVRPRNMAIRIWKRTG